MKRGSLAGISFVILAIVILPGNQVQAQTSFVTGTVYENDQTKTTFETPEGTIKVYLPDDMKPGDGITGMVVAQPEGKNEKVKSKNLQKLLRYSLNLSGSLIMTAFETVQNKQLASSEIRFTVPQEDKCSIILNSPGNKPFSSAEIPTISVYYENSDMTPSCILAKKVITNTEPLVLLMENSGEKSPVIILQKFYSPIYTGKEEDQYVLHPSLLSPGKAVCYLPNNLSGMYDVNIQLEDGMYHRIDLINIVDVRATIGKGSLRKGENTQMDIQVFGLQGCPFLPVELEITNLSPSVVSLEQGNQQLFPVDNSDDLLAYMKNQPFHSTQNVTGLTPGNFMVSTTLHIPPAAYTNKICPYIASPSSPEDFNATIDGLKEDIDRFTRMDILKPDMVHFLREIRNNLPVVDSQEDLQRAKSIVVNLLNQLYLTEESKELFDNLPALNEIHPEIAQKISVPQFVHPLHDYAGEFNSETRQLIVIPSCQEQLLNYLEAKETGNGDYTIFVNDGTNPVVYTDVQLKPVIPDRYYPKSVSLKNESHDAFQLWELPEEVEREEDKNRLIKSIFYKNAECATIRMAMEISCIREVTEVLNKETGKNEYKPTGRYMEITYYEIKQCVKGKETCTERWKTDNVTRYYRDDKCTHLLDLDKHETFMCP